MKTLHIVLLASVVSAFVSAGATAVFLSGIKPGTAKPAPMPANAPLTSRATVGGLNDRLPAMASESRSAGAMAGDESLRGDGRGRKTPQEIRLDSEQRFKQIYQGFKAEPVSPTWAKNTESMVRDAFASEEAVAMGVQVPLQAKIECRSSSCRIATVYASEGAASDAAQMLQMDIAGTLPRTQVMTFAQPDGTTQLILYADSRPLAAAEPPPPNG